MSASRPAAATPSTSSVEPSSDMNPILPVYRHALDTPDAPALVVDGQTLSYRALAEHAGRVATWIAAGTPRRRGYVAVLASRTLSAYAGIAGALWAGRTYVPLNPKMPRERLVHILRTVRPEALVVDAQGARLVDAEVLSICPRVLSPEARAAADGPSDGAAALDAASPRARPEALGPSDEAYVMFTSGTTGIPKGVQIVASSLSCFVRTVREMYRPGPADRFSQFSEVSFDFSVLDLFSCWDAGASLHVVPESEVLAPTRFIRTHALTFWASVPSAIVFSERVKMLGKGSLPSLRVSFFCGEALSAAAARAWQRAAPGSIVDNHYGPTEATVACSYYRFAEPPRTTLDRELLAIGAPYPGTELGVVADGAFVADRETGELAIWGPQLAIGYLKDDELTRRRFVTLEHPRLGAGTWYLTGDTAFRDPDGCFHVLGRMDNQVKVFGHRIELDEIDAHLRQASGSQAVATVAWPIEQGNALGLISFVAGAGLSDGRILADLAKRIPPYMMPKRVVILDVLPLSANGKIDRKALVRSLEEPPLEH